MNALKRRGACNGLRVESWIAMAELKNTSSYNANILSEGGYQYTAWLLPYPFAFFSRGILILPMLCMLERGDTLLEQVFMLCPSLT